MAATVPWLEELDCAYVRLVPPPVVVGTDGARTMAAPGGAIGVCRLRMTSPDFATVEVPIGGTYALEVDSRLLRVEPVDETDHGYQIKARVRLLGLRIVIDPSRTKDRAHIWTERT